MASWALMMIKGRISRPNVSPAERMVRPLAVVGSTRPNSVPLVNGSSSSNEDGQAQHAVDDGRNTGQVVDVGLDEPVDLVVYCVLFQVNGSANA